MDWKICICDFLNHYLPTLELEELVDLTTTKKLSPVVHFYSFSTWHIKDQKKASLIRKYTFCVSRCAFLFFFYLPTLELEELVD